VLPPRSLDANLPRHHYQRVVPTARFEAGMIRMGSRAHHGGNGFHVIHPPLPACQAHSRCRKNPGSNQRWPGSGHSSQELIGLPQFSASSAGPVLASAFDPVGDLEKVSQRRSAAWCGDRLAKASSCSIDRKPRLDLRRPFGRLRMVSAVPG